MDITKISVGKEPPHNVNVIIEVPMGTDPVKYEFDKDAGAVVVDRIIHTAMYYPCNYGFIPHTLAADGDPTDVLVVCQMPLVPGCVIAVRPIGILKMEDDGGYDAKILAVPVDKLNPFYKNVQEYTDLPEVLIEQIKHFFEHYKDLEKGKWVKIQGWDNAEAARQFITESIVSNKEDAA